MGKVAPHVQQAQGELANARAYGQGDGIRAAEKRLAAAGRTREVAASERRATAAKAEDPEQVRHAPPQDRGPAPQQTAQQITAVKRPPTSGPGSGIDAWRRYAAARTREPVESFTDLSRDEIAELVPPEDG